MKQSVDVDWSEFRLGWMVTAQITRTAPQVSTPSSATAAARSRLMCARVWNARQVRENINLGFK